VLLSDHLFKKLRAPFAGNHLIRHGMQPL